MANLTHTINGNIAQIRSPDQALINSFKINFQPKQTGSGSPSESNIRTIAGWTGITVKKCGKNLFNIQAPAAAPSNTASANSNQRLFTPYTHFAGTSWSNYISTSMVTSYSVENNTLNIVSKSGYGVGFAFPLIAGKTYVLSCQMDNYGLINVIWYKEDGTYISYGQSNINNVPITIPNDAKMTVFTFLQKSTLYGAQTATFTNIQLEEAYSKTTYQPYIETTFSANWQNIAGTSYGGSIDLINGILTVDRAKKVIDNTSNIQILTSGNKKYWYVDGLQSYNSIIDDSVISDQYASQPTISISNNLIGIRLFNRSSSSNVRLIIRPTDWSSYTTQTFKEYLGQHPLTVVYKLVTPITYSLTSQTIKTLRGITNFEAEQDASVEINYDLHETAEIQAARRKILVASANNGYQYVDFLYRSKEYSGPYCQLNWNLAIGDQITTKTLMLDTEKTESAFGASTGSVELYYQSSSGKLTTWQATSNTWIDNTVTILDIPNELSTTVISPFTFQMWGCYRIGRYPFMGRLYGVTVKNSNNILIHDLIPCFRKRDKVPGFFDKITKIFYPNAADTGSFELPVYIDGLPILVNNAYFGASVEGNGKFNNYSEDNNWFLAGPFDTGSSQSKSYTCIRHSSAIIGNASNKIRFYDDINANSIDYWILSGSDEPRTFTSSGRYIIIGIYKPKAADSYLYDNTNQRYIFKGSNVT